MSVLIVKEMKTIPSETLIPHTEDTFKPDLYALIKTHKPMYCTSTTDRILAKHGHLVLELSHYYPGLDQIKLIWAAVMKLGC
jgi:hypothetical protein